MTTASSERLGVSMLLLVLDCVGIAMMFMGGWYFQSSLIELRVMVINQREQIMVQKKEITAQRNEMLAQIIKTAKQEDTIEQLKEKLDDLLQHVQLQIQKGLFQIDIVDQNFGETISKNINAQNNVIKRSIAKSTNSSKSSRFLEILKRRIDQDGEDGPPGPRENLGHKRERIGGVVYVRWGHKSCPDTGAQLLYSGRAGGSCYSHKRGGGNPQCLPLDPDFYNTVTGAQSWAFMYGAEYEQTNTLVAGSHNTQVSCAVCYVPNRSVVYMIPAKYTCPAGWTTEYFGYLMSAYYRHHQSQFSCVDHMLTPVNRSHHIYHGFLFYPVEGVCGSLPCPPYNQDRELSCAVCTK